MDQYLKSLFLKHRILQLLVLFAIASSIGGSCISYEDVEVVSYNKVNLERIDPSGIYLVSNVTIKNPNKYKIKVDTDDMKLYLNDKFFGNARFDKTLELKVSSTEDYNVRIIAEIPPDGKIDLGQLTASAIFGGGIKIRVQGRVSGKAKGIKKSLDVDFERTLSL